MSDADEGPGPLEWFLSELDRRVTDPASKRAVIAILRGMAGQRMFLSAGVLVKAGRVRAARDLLAAGFTATQARKQMASSCGVSLRTAQRIVAKALSQRSHGRDDA